MSIGHAIDKLYDLREEKRRLEAELKKVRQLMEEEEINIFELFKQQDVTMSGGSRATCSVTETVVPVVDDYDKLQEHLLATGDLHLLERRVSSRAYREMLEAGEDVPGVRPFTKRALSLRSK